MTVQRISAAEFAAKHQSSSITTIDLRTAAECASECLDGCIALPVQELDKESFERVVNIANHSSGPIHLLCQSGRRADVAVSKLEGISTHDLVIIEGGLNALKGTGIALKQGIRKTISLERQVRIAAGSLTVLGVALGFAFNSYFFGLSAFVGAGLMFAGITDTCGMAMMLAYMPWNKVKAA